MIQFEAGSAHDRENVGVQGGGATGVGSQQPGGQRAAGSLLALGGVLESLSRVGQPSWW